MEWSQVYLHKFKFFAVSQWRFSEEVKLLSGRHSDEKTCTSNTLDVLFKKWHCNLSRRRGLLLLLDLSECSKVRNFLSTQAGSDYTRWLTHSVVTLLFWILSMWFVSWYYTLTGYLPVLEILSKALFILRCIILKELCHHGIVLVFSCPNFIN